jgi:hypothetical protein
MFICNTTRISKLYLEYVANSQNVFPKMKEIFFLFERKPSKELKHGVNVRVFLNIHI